MAFAAGALSQVAVGSTTDDLLSAPATGGTGPYTYQWYRLTTTGFSPGGGSILSGETSLTLHDTGLVPGTQYYYKVRATDTGNSNVTTDSAQLSVVTAAPELSQNQFAQTTYLGMVDLPYNTNTVACEVDSSVTTALYPGQAVKCVDSSGGVPKVVACTANTDEVFGFINYNIKNQSFAAGIPVEVSQQSNRIYLYSTGAIARNVQVTLDLVTRGGVAAATGSSANTLVGSSYDKATAAGELIRITLSVPSFQVDS